MLYMLVVYTTKQLPQCDITQCDMYYLFNRIIHYHSVICIIFYNIFVSNRNLLILLYKFNLCYLMLSNRLHKTTKKCNKINRLD